jgi:hypothetical protein
MAAQLSVITSQMVSPHALRTLLFGLAAAVAMGGAARAEPLGACLLARLSSAEQAHVLGAYQKDMAAGAAALERLGTKLSSRAAVCTGRDDIPRDWVQTIAGSQAVQTHVVAVLPANRHIDRGRLDAAWAAAPADVAACVRANGRLAFFSNGLGCGNPAASAWLLKRVGLDQSQQPAARQVLYYFNAKAIGEWGDKLVAGLAAKPAAKPKR